MEAIITWDDNWLQTLTTDSWFSKGAINDGVILEMQLFLCNAFCFKRIDNKF